MLELGSRPALTHNRNPYSTIECQSGPTYSYGSAVSSPAPASRRRCSSPAKNNKYKIMFAFCFCQYYTTKPEAGRALAIHLKHNATSRTYIEIRSEYDDDTHLAHTENTDSELWIVRYPNGKSFHAILRKPYFHNNIRYLKRSKRFGSLSLPVSLSLFRSHAPSKSISLLLGFWWRLPIPLATKKKEEEKPRNNHFCIYFEICGNFWILKQEIIKKIIQYNVLMRR